MLRAVLSDFSSRVRRLVATPAPPQEVARPIVAEVSGPARDAAPIADLPFDGYTSHRVHTRHVDTLTDDDLRVLNALLPWQCFTVDARGRRFGDRAWIGKRDTPQEIPDPRIVALNAKCGLRGRRVLELGCFEGIHTAALCAFGASVTAIDSRIENVVKTIVRCAMFGHSPTVFVCDLEDAMQCSLLPEVDVLHHVGVLYHLTDPVGHLRLLAPLVGHAIMLDTHFADDSDVDAVYESNGVAYRFRRHVEGGRSEVFSGMRDHAKWLRLDDIVGLLTQLGFDDVEIVDRRNMRNGPRVLLHALRMAPGVPGVRPR